MADQNIFERAANSELVDFRGKMTWVYVTDVNRFGDWNVTLFPDKDSLERLRKLQGEGMKNVLRMNEDGEWNIRIRRPTTIEFKKGVHTPVCPPRVRMADNSPVEGLIGDNSDGIVTCELYTHRIPNTERRAKAIRLYGVTVETLVPKAAKEPYQGDVEAPRGTSVWEQ